MVCSESSAETFCCNCGAALGALGRGKHDIRLSFSIGAGCVTAESLLSIYKVEVPLLSERFVVGQEA